MKSVVSAQSSLSFPDRIDMKNHVRYRSPHLFSSALAYQRPQIFLRVEVPLVFPQILHLLHYHQCHYYS